MGTLQFASGPEAPLFPWAGAAVSDNFFGGYIGAIKALNGDISTDGVLFRVDGIAGGYHTRSFTLGRTLHVGTEGGDLMVGYRAAVGSGWLSGYVGPTFETHDNPDITARVRGTKWGIKGIAEYEVPLSDKFQFFGLGSYGSPFSTYFVMARLGYDINPTDGVWLGPEVSAFGHEGYRDRRYGGFINIGTRFGAIGFSSGYTDALNTGRNGYYLNVNFSFDFH